MSFFNFIPSFLTLGAFLGEAHSSRKESIRFIDVKFHAESFQKKKKKKKKLKGIIIPEAC